MAWGYMTYQAAGSKKSLLVFNCEKCGERNVNEYMVYGGASVTYHVLYSREKIASMQKSAQAAAQTFVDSNDQKNYEQINIKHDYSGITNKIICKKCGQIQTWSNINKWSEKKLFLLWLIGFMISIMLIVEALLIPFMVKEPLNLLFYAIFYFLMFAPFGILLFIWLRYRSKWKKKTATISEPSYPRPIYVNAQNYMEVLGDSLSQMQSPDDTAKIVVQIES